MMVAGQLEDTGGRLNQLLVENVGNLGGISQNFHNQWTLIIQTEVNSVVSQIDKNICEINDNV
jgi:hypothetical protein